jgi:Type I phosphodiesterase / nucleotide pyrophosphatase/PA14 domain/Fn3 associated
VWLFGALMAWLGILNAHPAAAAHREPVKHVVIIGVDGMSPDGVQKADTPRMHEMMRRGSWTLHARGVLPTTSAANWASILDGVGPEQHGVTDNNWGATQFKFPSMVTGSGAFFPSIFQLLAEQHPTSQVGSVHEWEGFGALYDHRFVSFEAHGRDADQTAQIAVQYIKREKPEFLFVHLDLVDDAGHGQGHGSPGYYQAVAKADALIGDITDALKDAGIDQDTAVIVTSNHGGIGKGHGGQSLAELEIPWIASGARIRANNPLAVPVNTFDTPATVARLLGLEIPYAWIGRPVTAAIEGETTPPLRYRLSSAFLPPVILPQNDGGQAPSGGLFTTETVTVTMENPNPKGEIHYTLDNSVPTAASPVYRQPVEIRNSAIVRAMMFADGKAASTVSEGNFRILRDTNAHGLRYSIYLVEPPLVRLPDFGRLSPLLSGRTHEFSLNGIALPREDAVAVVFEGFIEIPAQRSWTFKTASDDGSKLYIDGKVVVDNDTTHGIIEAAGSVELAQGAHAIRVEYFNDGGGSWLGAWFEGPRTPLQYIDPNRLTMPH